MVYRARLIAVAGQPRGLAFKAALAAAGFGQFVAGPGGTQVGASWWLTSVHAGYELVSGGKGLTTTWFNVHI